MYIPQSPLLKIICHNYNFNDLSTVTVCEDSGVPVQRERDLREIWDRWTENFLYGCVHLKDHLECIEKSIGLSPGSGFLSVADMSITVTKGDVKLYSTDLYFHNKWTKFLVTPNIV